ncbi:porphobilinogen deaminase [Athelia psychrophila]|uniref:hydroxymethylbilane synthase n=1 Tax=Athelia psychrophila TaxID=1759441 RepID=A0A166DY14_9AGAM|nr:porphobilinogen deaminase [Fibularhizoctonia sp. CBS 109695]
MTSPQKTTFTIASRASKLAQIQTNFVRDALQAAHPHLTFATSFLSVEGDRNKVQALYLLAGKALWTKDLEVALKDGSVDMLVHSLKDCPTVLPAGLEIGAVPQRESPLDCLVVKQGKAWKSLDELPDGSVVGTSSVRRVAQLRRQFPKLAFLDCRGNIDTRLAKLDDPASPYAGIILAKAGLERMDLGHRVTADLGVPTLYHAVSQGALGVEIRADDAQTAALCGALVHWPTQWACFAERACLRVLEGGCSVPVGIDSTLEVHGEGEGLLKLTGCVTGLDGSEHVQHSLEGSVSSQAEAEALGVSLAKVLVDTGAKAILEDITKDRAKRVAEEDSRTTTKTDAEVAAIESAMAAPA